MMGEDSNDKGWRRRRRRRGRNAGQGANGKACLRDAKPGTTCRIKRLNGEGAIRQRLLDMGFVPTTEVTVVRSAPLLDPIEIRIGNAFVTVRRAEAADIEVDDD